MQRFLKLLALCTLLLPAQAWAHEDHVHPPERVGDVEVNHMWARATAPSAKTGAAYFTVSTYGTQPDRLLSVTTDAANKAELHTHLMENGVARMRPVDAIEVTPGSSTVLAPGGLHVMLMGLKQPLAKDDHFILTLTFEKAGKLDVPVMVVGPGAMGEGHMHHN